MDSPSELHWKLFRLGRALKDLESGNLAISLPGIRV